MNRAASRCQLPTSDIGHSNSVGPPADLQHAAPPPAPATAPSCPVPCRRPPSSAHACEAGTSSRVGHGLQQELQPPPAAVGTQLIGAQLIGAQAVSGLRQAEGRPVRSGRSPPHSRGAVLRRECPARRGRRRTGRLGNRALSARPQQRPAGPAGVPAATGRVTGRPGSASRAAASAMAPSAAVISSCGSPRPGTARQTGGIALTSDCMATTSGPCKNARVRLRRRGCAAAGQEGREQRETGCRSGGGKRHDQTFLFARLKLDNTPDTVISPATSHHGAPGQPWVTAPRAAFRPFAARPARSTTPSTSKITPPTAMPMPAPPRTSSG